MKNTESSQAILWLLIFFIPLLCLIVLTRGMILSVLPVVATTGVKAVIFGTYPNAVSMRVMTVVLLGFCGIFLFLGIKKRKKLIGKILVASAFYGWCFIGFMGMVGAYG